MQWQTLYWNQQFCYSLDIRMNSDLSGQLYTYNFMLFKISLASCKHASLLLLCLLLYQRKYKYIKTLATEVPSSKPICTILQICEPWILHSFADCVSVPIGYSTGLILRFPVSNNLKEHSAFIFKSISLTLEDSNSICKSQEQTVVYDSTIVPRNVK